MQYENDGLVSDEVINIRQIIRKIIPYWPWFVASVAVSLIAAFLWIQTCSPSYVAHATLLVKSDERAMNLSNVFMNQSAKTNIANEAGIIQAIRTKQYALKFVNTGVSYFTKDRYKTIEQYSNPPFRVFIDSGHVQPLNISIEFEKTESQKFHIQIDEEKASFGKPDQLSADYIKPIQLDTVIDAGEWLTTADFSFRIQENRSSSSEMEHYFMINSVARQIGFFANLKTNSDKESALLTLSLETPDPKKSADLLNALIHAYQRLETSKKIDERGQTIDFIDQLLVEVSDTLELYEEQLTQFQIDNLTIGIAPKSTLLYNKYSDLQNKLSRLSLQQRYYKHVAKLLQTEEKIADLISPGALGINEPVVTDLVAQMIDLYAQKSEISYNTRKDNPYTNVLDEKISQLKNSLITNINNNLDALALSRKEYEEQFAQIEQELSELPLTNKHLNNYERRFNVIDDLYTFLLKRRSEARIERAGTRPVNDVIQFAGPLTTTINQTNSIQIFIIALLLGLILPFVFIQGKSFLNNAIEDEDQVRRFTSMPLLGHIIRVKKNNKEVFDDPASPEAECFRTIRANTGFFFPPDQIKRILVTSSQKGDGKSFVAYNLASSFAFNGQKTIYIDFDLRKSNNPSAGLSNYLIGEVALTQIIMPVANNLDQISSGPLPPNPGELVGKVKTRELFRDLEQKYDVIIVDTPPLMPVFDAALLAEFTNLQIILVRLNHTSVDVFKQTLDKTAVANMSNATLLVNDIQKTNQYYYSYNGYR
ncbi:MAG: polysaccharide biosynthesis tyrosine autokinase [Salinivirgaceae bacterium]